MKRSYRGILVVALSCAVLFILLSLLGGANKGRLGHWTSPQGEAAYAEAYAETMKLLPEPSRILDLPTTFGSVRCYEWVGAGHASDEPIVLLPGRGSGVPMWAANLEGLARSRRVYALDALGDAGMSLQSAPILNGADQARWLEEAFSSLGLARIHLVGHSFGGWLAANFASQHPRMVASLSLLEPVYVFKPIRLGIILKSIPYSLGFLPRAWRESFILEIGGAESLDRSDPLARMVDEGTMGYASALPPPSLITAESLRSWDFPVYLALGGASPIHDAAACLEVATASIPRLRAEIVVGAGHSLPMEYPRRVDEAILSLVEASTR